MLYEVITLGHLASVGKKQADIIQTVIDGPVQQGIRIQQPAKSGLHILINILEPGFMPMAFIEMQQPSHQLKQVKYNGKMRPELFELPVVRIKAALNYICVKGGLKVVDQHFIAPDFHFIDFSYNFV